MNVLCAALLVVCLIASGCAVRQPDTAAEPAQTDEKSEGMTGVAIGVGDSADKVKNPILGVGAAAERVKDPAVRVGQTDDTKKQRKKSD